jgi:carbonic anhydrase
MIRLVVALACAVLLAGCGGGGGEDESEAAPAWSHNLEDAALGPSAWGDIDESFEQCAVGTEQSPVDIADAVEADLPVLRFDYPETSLVVENTGHVIEARPAEGDHMLLVGDDEYRLLQFHLHAPSEHTVDGSPYAAEAHLVHESDGGELAVVGVLIHPTGSPATALVDAVVEAAPDEAGAEAELEGEWSLAELLLGFGETTIVGPPYHTYSGSLTTPGCSEGVRWIVIQTVLPTSQEAVERLHELIAGFPGYDGYPNNNRPTQPLNDRVIENDPPS